MCVFPLSLLFFSRNKPSTFLVQLSLVVLLANPQTKRREALCPGSIDLGGLSTDDKRANFELAFDVSESKLDQIALLDVEDCVEGPHPDAFMVMYV